MPKCQIPDSLNEAVLRRKSTPLVVCSKSPNDLCPYIPEKDLCWLVSVRSSQRAEGRGQRGSGGSPNHSMCDFATAVCFVGVASINKPGVLKMKSGSATSNC